MKVLLIDGNSIANRAYFGIRPLTAADGTPTNAIYGFFSILRPVIESEKPEGMCVAFDCHAPTFRHEYDTEYKANRGPMPDDLRIQMPLIKKILDCMSISRTELPGWEADDVLGTLARRCEAQGNQAVILTGDKDSLQLVSDATRVLNIRTKAGETITYNYTPEAFREEYGFEAPKMVDLKALMGDSSDNICGVPGCGEKTARTLLQTFGSLEEVYANLEDPVIKPAMRQKLKDGQECAQRSFYLATIDCNAPVEELDMTYDIDNATGAKDLLQSLGLNNIIRRYM